MLQLFAQHNVPYLLVMNAWVILGMWAISTVCPAKIHHGTGYTNARLQTTKCPHLLVMYACVILGTLASSKLGDSPLR
jgi:hypothetical protein